MIDWPRKGAEDARRLRMNDGNLEIVLSNCPGVVCFWFFILRILCIFAAIFPGKAVGKD